VAGGRIVSALFFIWLGSAQALAAETDEEFDLRIPATRAETAIKSLSRLTGYSVIYQSGDVEHLRTKPLAGRYTLQQALDALLHGTGLTGGVTKGGVITISPDTSAKARDLDKGEAMRAETTRKGTFAGVLAGILSILTAQSASSQDDPDEVLEEVVVTGSRIVKRDYVANSPIVSMDSEILDTFGSVELERKLSYLPQFAPGETSFDAGLTGGTRNRTSLNLRGLTSTRNLVLLDGRRAQPSSSDLIIDVQTIPSALIDRVEIITGGASAVYGSDAISGVVNFILKKDFEGVEGDFQYGFTEEGEGETINAALTLGSNFAENRGNATLSFSYFDRDDIRNNERDFYRREVESGIGGDEFLPQGVYNPAIIGLVGPAVSPTPPTFFGVFGPPAGLNPNRPSAAAYATVFGPQAVPGSRIGFNNDGTLFTQNNVVLNYKGPGIDEAMNIAQNGTVQYWGSYAGRSLLQTPIERYNGFGHLTYGLTDDIKVYGQFMVTKSTGINQDDADRAAFNVWDLIVPVTNPFIPPDLATLLASRPAPGAPFTITKTLTQWDRKLDLDNSLYQILVGAKGEISAYDLNWEVYGSYGETDSTATQFDPGGTLWSRALDLLDDPDGGASKCAGGFNPFGTNPVSAECIDYMTQELPREEHLNQGSTEATISGHLFDLPSGELLFAAGFGWRQDRITTRLDSLINGDTATGDVIIVSPSRPTEGETEVWELFAELEIPLLKDLPGVVDLTSNAGYRYSDYKTAGGAHSYKADLSWTVMPSFRVRGGYQRAIRAPNIGELFGGTVGGAGFIGFFFQGPGQGDPCDIRGALRNGPDAAQVRQLCLDTGMSPAVVDTFTYGPPIVGRQDLSNPLLDPEKADTFTAGFVWQPEHRAFDQLSFSADYYRIEIEDAINPITGVDALRHCFNVTGLNSAYDANNMFCDQIHRDSGTFITLIETVLVNSGGIETDGVEIQADVGFGLSTLGLGQGSGSLNFNFVGTYVNSFEITQLAGLPTLDYAGINVPFVSSDSISSQPEWKFNLATTYSVKSVVAGLRWRFLDSMEDESSIITPGNVLPGVGSYHTLDFFANWAINDTYLIRGGIDNLTDEDPNEVRGLAGVTDERLYDPIGRRFYLAVSARF
jgi:outer membrane receptor protein involved in Fe transport